MRHVVESLTIEAFTIPTASLESDGTHEWTETTLLTVRLSSGGHSGFGYSYTSVAAASLVEHTLAAHVLGTDIFSPRAAFDTMVRAVRNVGRPGLASTAISAVDIAFYDLKARALQVPLLFLSGNVRREIPVYGSGGFTSYTMQQLQDQLGGWASDGIPAVKMKIGRHPEHDVQRVRTAREAIGSTGLYVDANGALDRKRAMAFAESFAEVGVSWFEEPVSSDDLRGLRLLRDRGPAGMDIAAGEYGYDVHYFMRMLEAGAVDVLQIDATRCGGVTGFLHAAALAEPFEVPVSAHTAPSVHGHLCCVASKARNVEYFFDHTRIEQMLFDGALIATKGRLCPDLSRHGLGITFKAQDAERYRVYSARLSKD